MFEILDDNIQQFEYDDMHVESNWRESGAVEITADCLDAFTEEDWKRFYEEIPQKSTVWKKRFIDCVLDYNRSESLKALLYLTDTDDKVLFTRIIDNLLDSDLDLPKAIDDVGMSVVYDRVEKMLPVVDTCDQAILEAFLKKKTSKYPDVKIFTDNIEDAAKKQIDLLMEQDAFKNSKVRIMPDVHSGKGCVIGFAGDLGDKVIPSIVGGDIGCGMFCADLGPIDIDYKKLDDFIYSSIPSGDEVNSEKVVDFDFSRLYCFKRLKNMNLLENSIGTLGGGNHFIEIDESKDGEKFLVIHTGSRNLGAQVANYYQNLADQICNYKILELKDKIDQLIVDYKNTGRERELDQALRDLREEYRTKKGNVPYEYAYLEGKYREAYLHDMKICQEYAELNRLTIAKRIADYMGWSIQNHFESVHNYISFDDNIVRKGAISAKEGEPVIIPMNMRDGCLIGLGKGNPDWNYSAPHGAGRIMSRKEASERIDLDEYQEAMAGIYTTSVTEDTRDEAPFVYKPMEEIMQYITPTVDVTEVIKPVYNFKASGTRLFKEVEDVETNTIVK